MREFLEGLISTLLILNLNNGSAGALNFSIKRRKSSWATRRLVALLIAGGV